MPSWQFSYPYNAADTGTVLFDGSPADSSYRWDVPLRDNPQPKQSRVRTADGSVTVYDHGVAPRVIRLRFRGLPEGNAGTATELRGYLGLKAFLETHTDFGLASFGYYDHAGSAELEVRYAGGIESFERGVGGYYGGEIVLEEVV